ncbi:MAG: OmpH family outer membrane protein [Gemmatimonadaceae bacterium]|nr:OmpH family outer membrane protein [Gemmatimonadaceae bacterium]
MFLPRSFVMIAVAGLSLSAAPLSAQQKFAFVDSRIIVQRAPGAIAAQAALEKESADMQARVKVWQDSLRALADAYEKVRAGLTEAQRTTREKQITDRQADYAKRAEEMDNAMQVRQQELSQPVMAQIRETLEDLRKEEGYTFIFDVAATGVIVAADKNLDLTEKVVGRLKPIPVAARADSAAKLPLGAKAQPAGVTKKP